MHVSPSNKRYIGLTSQKPEYRWNNGKGYGHNKYFTNAIEKYGWDNFEHIIIARGLTEDEAKWLEIELIREWGSMNRDKGYNLTKGGEGANGLICSEETRKKISEANRGENNPVAKKVILLNTKEIFLTITLGAEKYNVGNTSISNCCNEELKSAGKLDDGTPLVWMYYRDYLNITEEEKRNKMKEADSRVILLNTNEIFSSITEGAKEYNINQGNISQCCNKKLKSAGKHPVTGEKLIWMFYSEYNKNI